MDAWEEKMKLSDLKIVLASGSPRRLEMLEREGLEPYVMRTGCSEDIHLDLGPARTVMALALRKGLEAEQRVAAGEGHEYIRDGRPFVIISADTVVYKDGKIYGKPADEEEALAMLRDLSGDVHQVYSGVFLNIKGTAKKLLFYDRTDVFVKEVGSG
jgi:septum formation protein